MANESFQISIQMLSGKREILQCCQSAICQHQCDPKKCCSFFVALSVFTFFTCKHYKIRMNKA